MRCCHDGNTALPPPRDHHRGAVNARLASVPYRGRSKRNRLRKLHRRQVTYAFTPSLRAAASSTWPRWLPYYAAGGISAIVRSDDTSRNLWVARRLVDVFVVTRKALKFRCVSFLATMCRKPVFESTNQ